MNIQITGQHIDITEALQTYVHKRLERIAEHAGPSIGQLRVVLHNLKPKIGNSAEATVHYAGHDLHASATDPDMYAAIDAMADKLHRQVIQTKEKQRGQ